MRFFRRKKNRNKEEEGNAEINNMVEALQKQIDTKDAQIITFKEDIAPQMAETIQALKSEIERLQKTLNNREQEIKNQQEMIQKISSTSAKLQKEGATDLLIKSQNEAIMYKKQLSEQSDIIKKQSKTITDLQKKVDLLPVICTRLVEEINNRNSTIQYLYNELDKIKGENVSLSLDIVELESKLEEVLKNLEDKEMQTRKILSSIEL